MLLLQVSAYSSPSGVYSLLPAVFPSRHMVFPLLSAALFTAVTRYSRQVILVIHRTICSGETLRFFNLGPIFRSSGAEIFTKDNQWSKSARYPVRIKKNYCEHSVHSRPTFRLECYEMQNALCYHPSWLVWNLRSSRGVITWCRQKFHVDRWVQNWNVLLLQRHP